MGNGESKRADADHRRRRLPQTIGEQVLIQGKGSIESVDPAVTAAVKDTCSASSASTASPTSRARSTRGPRQHRLRGRPLRGRQLQPPGPTRTATSSSPVGRRAARRGRRRPEGASRSASRSTAAPPGATRSRQGGCGRGEVHAVLDGRHAAHPADRVRRHGRRRRPAAARPDLGGATVRPARSGQPALRASSRRRPGRDARRPRRRRRLRDVLHAPGGGEGQGPVRAARSTSPPPPPAAPC